MPKPQVPTERRKYTRVIVKSDAYTMNSSKPGLIIDICLGGLSFRYIDRKEWPEETYTLDIVSGEDEDFRLVGIPYRIVSDYEMKSDVSYEKMVIKRRSVEFGLLSEKQILQLQHFIDLNQALAN